MKVRVSDNEGTWLEDDGSTIITVWTSNGWRSLPGEYDCCTDVNEHGEDMLYVNIPDGPTEIGPFWTWVEVNPDDFEEVA